MSYQKVIQARKKLADVKAKKPVQQFGWGGISVGDITDAGSPIQNAQHKAVNGVFGAGVGKAYDKGMSSIGQVSAPISDYLSARLPQFNVGGGSPSTAGGSGAPGLPNVNNPFQFHNPGTFQTPTGIVNPFDAKNPTVQAMNQQSALSSILPQQQQLANALQQQALGQGGPGQQLAQAMLNQATQQNIQQGAGLIASQRGLNPALASRLIANQTANANQQAAMQGTQLGLQTQLNAQQQLGSLYGTMGNQALGNQDQHLQALGQYNNVLNQGQINANTLNKDVGIANLGAATGTLGGLMNAGGSILSSALGKGGILNDSGGGGSVDTGSETGGNGDGSVNGTPGSYSDNPSGPTYAAHGALVPGQAKYDGDDLRNDKVKAELSPGEIVIPRSISEHPDAPWLAAKFVAQVLAGKGPKPTYKKADGGGVSDASALTNSAFQSAGPQDSSITDWLIGGGGPAGSESLVGAAAEKVPEAARALGNTVAQGGRSYRGEPSADIGSMANAAPAAFDQVPMATAVAPKVNINTLDLPGSVAGGQTSQNPYAGVMDGYSQAFGQQEAGIKGAAAAAEQEAKGQAQAYQNFAQQQQLAQQKYQQGLETLDHENAQLTQAYMNGKIDPNRVWGNASTGNKVMAAIGIALSGIGSGLTGQPNMAMSVINKMIDRDIDAQKADLGKTQTLLSMNLQKYGRLDQAYAATSSQLHSMVQAQVAMEAARAGSPKAAANAQMLLGQLGMQKAQTQQTFAALNAFQGSGQSGSGNLGDRLRLGVQSGAIPKELVPGAMKEFGEYTKLGNSLGSVDAAFDKVKSLQTIAERVGSPFQSKAQIDAAEKIFSAQLAKDLEGRATPQDIDSIMENFPALKDNGDTVKQKRVNLHNSIKSKFSFPTLQSYGLLNSKDPSLAPTVGVKGAETLQAGGR